jgi:glycosyltransferase involved in cell wall biosynthesis
MANPKLVSVVLPIWKRLEYLPHVLKIIEAQDYPSIELVVSDNGENGTKVHDAVKAYYSRPFRFRQNAKTVSVGTHFNQILEFVSGEYFALICDDDEISSNYISALVGQLEEHPEASIAFARQEIINEEGVVIRRCNEFPAQVLSGMEFIRGLWQTFAFGFEAIGTFVARTAKIRERGCYPDFVHGNGIDNALVIKLCLDSNVVLNPECTWRWRVHETGYGWAVSPKGLASALTEYMRFLDRDPVVRKLAAVRSGEWRALKRELVSNEWHTYFWRWRDIYKNRLSAFEWIKAAFAMPFIPSYYRNVGSVFREEAKLKTKKLLGISAPPAKEVGYFERNP